MTEKSKKLELFYDMDNTLFEMSKPLVGSYSGKIGSYGKVNGLTNEQIIERLHQEGFFEQLTPIQNSPTILKRLDKAGYTIRILSQPMINEYCIKEKNNSLKKYLPFFDLRKATYTFDKYLLANNNRVLIDDHVHHLETWQENNGIAVCFSRGYNKSWQGYKIKKHKEIFELLEHLEKERI